MDASFLILLAFFGVMYLLLIRPQQRRQKAHREMMQSVSVGDDIVTIGGLHGTVTALDDETIDLTVSADGTVLRFQRSSIAKVVPPDVDELGDTGEAFPGTGDEDAGSQA